MGNNRTPYPPYIGITDFMNREQTEEMLEVFRSITGNGMLIPHKLMIGVMMSYKTLRGLPTKWTKAFPAKEKIGDIFVANPLLLNTLHYADYTNTDVAASLEEAIAFCGNDIDVLQLDMVWPNPFHVAKAVEKSSKAISVILQVGRDAMEIVQNDPNRMLWRLMNYEGIIDGVLFDKSMGNGVPLDSEVLRPFVEITAKLMPYLQIAIAGGLGPETMHVASPLVHTYPDISIDAQGRLRPSGSALDPIDWDLAEQYLKRAVDSFASLRS